MTSVTSKRIRNIVLTVDYEIYGSGAGDVVQHIIKPTERMARLCNKYQMPLTVFFEVEEYLAFRRHCEELKRTLRYDPAAMIQDQIKLLGKGGHDIQLHLHPQWFGARHEKGKWLLHHERQTVDDLFESQRDVTRYIADRKAVIEEMLRSEAPGRKVRAYRAGAFAARPGRKLLTALAENDILIDSSVVKGLHQRNGCRYLDYRDASSSKGPWRVKEDVAREDTSGPVWEFPIYSQMRRRLHQASFRRLRAKFSRNVPKDRQQEMLGELGVRGASPLQFFKFLREEVPIKLDFHNVSPAKLLKWIRSAPKPTNGNPDVLVLIGHTKEHIDDKAFENLLAGIAKDPTLKVVTFDYLANVLEQTPAFPQIPCPSFDGEEKSQGKGKVCAEPPLARDSTNCMSRSNASTS